MYNIYKLLREGDVALTILEKRKRILLYRAYCMELRQYDDSGMPYSFERADNVADIYISNPNFEWKDIYCENKLSGFLITSRNLNHIHGKGLYFCEAYMVPWLRRKGIMEEEVLKVLDPYKGPVYMEIYEKNQTAHLFWKEISNRSGLSLVRNTPLFDYECLHEFEFSK